MGTHKITAKFTGDQGFNNTAAPNTVIQAVLNGNLEDHFLVSMSPTINAGSPFGLNLVAVDVNGVRTPLAAGHKVTVSIQSGPTGARLGGITTVALNSSGALSFRLAVTLKGDYTLLLTDLFTHKTQTVTIHVNPSRIR